MIPAIRSEFRKFFTTRLWWGMLIPTVLAGGLFAWLAATLIAGSQQPGAAPAPDLDNPQMVSTVYTFGLNISRLILLAIGVLMVGSEYRHKTITGTFLGTPKRARVMGAKVVALLVIGALYGVVQTAASFGVGAFIINNRGFPILPDGAARTLALSLLVLGLWGLIGLGAGILIPNQVAALLIAVGVAWIVEPLLGLLFASQDWGKSIAPYLPSNATNAVVNAIETNPNGATQLSWWAGALALLAYAVVMAGLGTWRTLRADIS
ncbi:ABC transporter permease [Intrasporangium oryzae NRRL B-24470]|uniref:ABC transporter permease n=1 Tax=Intrasporangium oryzae NRRL B-24470 TaxID=1386089 RepID=W9G340_9MICO|nr:ABC transporter permease subunit [Intrasporangium oryzae]EWS99716.1 ABC transporter permease [Intrasporangium oryzae NRRL B-24470]